jgi:hypothetical protein
MSLNANSVIADNRGHLLPGVERSKRSPFGEFIGTWDLPKKIPGPYHVHPMGRTDKNFNSLCAERDRTIQEMEKARTYQVNKNENLASSIDLFICLVERRISSSTELISDRNIFFSKHCICNIYV